VITLAISKSQILRWNRWAVNLKINPYRLLDLEIWEVHWLAIIERFFNRGLESHGFKSYNPR